MNSPLDPLDSKLRQLAQELHDAAPLPRDWDDITTPPSLRVVKISSPPRPRWALGAVAAAFVVLAGLLVVRTATHDPRPALGTDSGPGVDSTVDPTVPSQTTPATNVPSTAERTDETDVATEQPATTTMTTAPATPATTAPIDLPPIVASYLEPPPLLDLGVIATLELAIDPLRSGPASTVVNFENGAAVVDLPAREIIVTDPSFQRRVPLDPAIPDLVGLAVGGPDRIVYIVLQPGRQTNQAATDIVAIPTDGPRAGQAVATAPFDLVSYTHTSPTVLGLGPTGVIDKRTGRTLIDYVDASGQPLRTQVPAPAYPLADTTSDPWAALETGLDITPTNGDPATWRVEVDRYPTATSGLGDDPEPTAIGSGRVLVTTAIGPNLSGDYGEPTQQVVAILEPDGTGSWRSVPDDWSLAAADLYGPLYTRITNNILEIARPTPAT